jgi:hypothetical protein
MDFAVSAIGMIKYTWAHIDALQYWDDMDRGNDLTLERYQVMRFPAWVVRYQPEHIASKIRQPLRNAGYRC